MHEQIWDDEHVNAWLICWSEDHDTGFHDHDESAAAILVIEGHVREDRLRLNSPAAAHVIGPGRMFFVPPTAIHRVLHAGAVPAVTIHAYSPPLRRIGAYRIGRGGELKRAAQSHEQELRPEPALLHRPRARQSEVDRFIAANSTTAADDGPEFWEDPDAQPSRRQGRRPGDERI